MSAINSQTEVLFLRGRIRELVASLKECVTSPGAACFRGPDFAINRINYINEVALDAIELGELVGLVAGTPVYQQEEVRP